MKALLPSFITFQKSMIHAMIGVARGARSERNGGKKMEVSRLGMLVVSMVLLIGAVGLILNQRVSSAESEIAVLKGTAGIGPGAVDTTRLAANAVTSAKIADSAVTTDKLEDSAVTSAKIADLTIVVGDIATGAVTTAKIADLAVTGEKLATGGIPARAIADGAVTTVKIADLNVTTAKIAANAVISAKLDDSIELDNLYAIRLLRKPGILNVTMDNVVLENLRASGTLDVDRAATLGSTLGVTGLMTASGGITVPTGQAVNLVGTTTLTVGTGATSLGGTLGVTGLTTVTGVKVTGKLDTRGAAENSFMDNLVVENLRVTNYIWPVFIQRGENTLTIPAGPANWFSITNYYPTPWAAGEIPNVVVTAENLDETGCGIVTIDAGTVASDRYTVLVENVSAVVGGLVKIHWIAVYYT